MITTPRLQLVPVSESLLTALLTNQPLLVDNVPITVPRDWADLWVEHPGALEYTLQGLKDDPTLETSGWWGYLIIHQAEKKLVGMGGFRGKPNAEGTVEIGYSIIPSYRTRGLATEAAQGMTDFALNHSDAGQVMAHTLAQDNHSNQLLKRIGFRYNGNNVDPDEGEVWQWVFP